MKVELIYFEGCPHADAARANIRAALDALRATVPVVEWNRESDSAPQYARHYGSPTVLVDGRDVTGQNPRTTPLASCCAMVGAPSTATILRALSAS